MCCEKGEQEEEEASTEGAYPASISGTLCRSTTSEEKFSSVRAAVRALLTAFR